MEQLVLPLSVQGRFSFDDLTIHPGIREAVTTMRTVYLDGEAPFPLLFLWGGKGTGKTHLLKALLFEIEKQRADGLSPVRYAGPEGTPPTFPALKDIVELSQTDVEELRAVAVDDVHLLDDHGIADLWNLTNQLSRTGRPLITSSRTEPAGIFPANDHMRSRVLSGLVIRLEPPEDHARMMIADKIARDRNVRIHQDVFRYLLARKSRNIKDLENMLDKLDRASLARKRRITIPLIKDLEREGLL